VVKPVGSVTQVPGRLGILVIDLRPAHGVTVIEASVAGEPAVMGSVRAPFSAAVPIHFASSALAAGLAFEARRFSAAPAHISAI
jgi:hypothetical protein